MASPSDVQLYLDGVPYSTDPFYRSPRQGYPARVVWVVAENDDGHLLAVFRGEARQRNSETARQGKSGGAWGAVGKSNFVGLRYRPPVYRSLRELVMSYFNDYFNSRGDRSMRGYTRPLSLARFDRLRWQTDEKGVERVVDVELDRLPVSPVVSGGEAAKLGRVDERTLKAGMMGTEARGLYRVR